MKKFLSIALCVLLLASITGCASKKATNNVKSLLEKEGVFDSSWEMVNEDEVGVSNMLMSDGFQNLGLTVEYYTMDNGNVCWLCIDRETEEKGDSYYYNVVIGTDLSFTEVGTCIVRYEKDANGNREPVYAPEYEVDKQAESVIKFYKVKGNQCVELSESPFDWY